MAIPVVCTVSEAATLHNIYSKSRVPWRYLAQLADLLHSANHLAKHYYTWIWKCSVLGSICTYCPSPWLGQHHDNLKLNISSFIRIPNKQLSKLSIVYGISVCHIAGEFGHFLKNQIDEAKRMKKWPHESITLDEKEVLCLQIAGLCHDLGKYFHKIQSHKHTNLKFTPSNLYINILGHGPFSHAFERVMDYLETEDVKVHSAYILWLNVVI